MTLTDLADETYREMAQDSSLSIPFITFWMRGNFGNLNTRLHTDFELNEDTLEITPALGVKESVIFKKMFLIYFYENKIRTGMGAMGWDSAISVSSDGAEVKLVSRNDIAKTYINIKKGEVEALELLIRDYKINRSGPVAVHGDDTVPATQNPIDEFNRVSR